MTLVLQKPKQKSIRSGENKTAWGLAMPALTLIVSFIVLPVVIGLGLGFTNAQLLSPTVPEFTGLSNFRTLLGVSTTTLNAERNPDGTFVKDESGQIVYENLRDRTREGSKYPNLVGKSEIKRYGENLEEGTIKVLLAGDPSFWRALTNTLFFALIVVPIQGGFALLLALLVNSKLKGRNFFRTIYFIPTVTSMVVISMLWRFIYQNDGLLNKSIANVDSNYKSIDWLSNPKTAMYAIIFMSIWQAVGYHMIIWLGGLQTIPAELYEAVRMDGASAWHEFRYVTLPGLRHTFIFILITITIAALGLFVQVSILTNGGPLDATTTLVHQAFTKGYGRQQIGYGSAISFVFFGLVLVISLIQRALTRKLED
ncbi:MAG: sugar ABC transporter permease [Acidobacteriota bacterium]|nr:sugar ABC transporter permease [Acidobacteriota bacterium]